MQSTTIAVDIAKNVLQVATSRKPGKVHEEVRLSRSRFLDFMARQEAANVVFEACGSAHHWGRELQKLDHRPVLLPAAHVAPYRRGNKTDRTDTHALLEAFRNESIQAVPVKTIQQQTMLSLHRLRSQWIAERTRRINNVRGLLRELGHFLPKGAHRVVSTAWELLEDAESPLPRALRRHLAEAVLQIRKLQDCEASVTREIEGLGRDIPQVPLLQTIPGIGPITSTALVATLGNVDRFPTSRHLSSYLGLTPREVSTGQKRWLGSITKRGDRYLRTNLVHGARSALNAAARTESPDELARWALSVRDRQGHNIAAVALANKLARIAWAVWRSGKPYRAERAAPKD